MKDLFPLWMRKLFFFLLTVKVALIILADLIRSASQIELLIAFLIVSAIAYSARKMKSGLARKSRTTSTGERTPVMPRSGR